MYSVSRQASKVYSGRIQGLLGNIASSVEITAIVGRTEYVDTLSCSGVMAESSTTSTAEHQYDANIHFRQLVRLHIHISLFTEIVSHGGHGGYGHGRPAISVLQTLMASKVMPDLGAVHRACLWENIVLKAGLTSLGVDVAAASDYLSGEDSPVQASTPTPAAGNTSHTGVARRRPNPEDLPLTDPDDEHEAKGPRVHNSRALLYLAHGFSAALAPLWQGTMVTYIIQAVTDIWIIPAIVKMFYARRNPDHSQKKQIMDSAAVMADVMLKHLKQELPSMHESLTEG
jgi:E3 ubiquitin-protein ligase HUWE1